MISICDKLESHIFPGLSRIISLDIHPVFPWIVCVTLDGTVILFNTETSSLLLEINLETFLSEQKDEVVLSKQLIAQYGNIILPHWFYSHDKSEMNYMFEKKIARILDVKFVDGNVSFWKMHNLHEVTHKSSSSKEDNVFFLKHINELDDRFHVEKKYIVVSCPNRILVISYDEIHQTVHCCRELRSSMLEKHDITCFEVLCTKPVIAVGCTDGCVRFWNYMTGKMLRNTKINAASKSILRMIVINRNDPLTPEFPYILCCSYDGTLSLWNVEQRRRVFGHRVPGGIGIADMLYIPEKDLVVLIYQDRSISVWELENYNLLKNERRKGWVKDLGIKNHSPRLLSSVCLPFLSPYISSDFLYVGVNDGTCLYRIPLGLTIDSKSHTAKGGLSPDSVFRLQVAKPQKQLKQSKQAKEPQKAPKGKGKGGKGKGKQVKQPPPSKKKVGKSGKGQPQPNVSSKQGVQPSSQSSSRRIVAVKSHPHHPNHLFVVTQGDGILQYRVGVLKERFLPEFRSCVVGISRIISKKKQKPKIIRSFFYLDMHHPTNTLRIMRRRINERDECLHPKAQEMIKFDGFNKNFLSYVHLGISPSGRFVTLQFYEPVFQTYIYDSQNKFFRVFANKGCRWVCWRLIDSGIDEEKNIDFALLNVKKKVIFIKNMNLNNPQSTIHEQIDHIFGGRYLCAVKWFQKPSGGTPPSTAAKKGKSEGTEKSNVFSTIYFIDWNTRQEVKRIENLPNIPKSIQWDRTSYSFSILFKEGFSIFHFNEKSSKYALQSYIKKTCYSLYWCGGSLFVFMSNGSLKCFFPNFNERNDYEEIDLTTKDVMKYSQLFYVDPGTSKDRKQMGKSGGEGDKKRKAKRKGTTTKTPVKMGIGTVDQENVDRIVSFKPLISVGMKQNYQQIMTILGQKLYIFNRAMGSVFCVSFKENIFLKYHLLVQCGRVKESLKWLQFLPNEIHVVLIEFLFKKLQFEELMEYKSVILEAIQSPYLKYIVLQSLVDHILKEEKADDSVLLDLVRESMKLLNSMREYDGCVQEEIGDLYYELCCKVEEKVLGMKNEIGFERIEEFYEVLDVGYRNAWICRIKKYAKVSIMYFAKRSNNIEMKKILDAISKDEKMKKEYNNEMKLLETFLGLKTDLNEKFKTHLKFE